MTEYDLRACFADIMQEQLNRWMRENPDIWSEIVTQWHLLTGYDPKPLFSLE